MKLKHIAMMSLLSGLCLAGCGRQSEDALAKDKGMYLIENSPQSIKGIRFQSHGKCTVYNTSFKTSYPATYTLNGKHLKIEGMIKDISYQLTLKKEGLKYRGTMTFNHYKRPVSLAHRDSDYIKIKHEEARRREAK